MMLIVKMTTKEKNPRAQVKEFMGSVCNDSCLEFFFTTDKKNYINCEMNSIGTQHTAAGARPSRVSIDQVCDIPVVIPDVKEDEWSTTVIFTSDMFEKLTGEKLESGLRFYANFYKCGDSCDEKHYLMWHEVIKDFPSFHEPEQFGTVELE